MSASAILRLPELHQDNSDTEHTDVPPSDLDSLGSKTNIPGPNTADSRLIYHIQKSDIILLLGIIVMLCWPWVLFGVLMARETIPLNDGFANYVNKHSRTTTFFITQIGTIVNLIVGFLFSTSILRYSQGWMAPKEHISFFHLSLISAFKNHSLPQWKLSDRKYLLSRKRWIRAALVLACIYAFTFIAPGVTTILTPLPIPLNSTLLGTELDFSPHPNATTCLEWLNTQATSMTDTCQWKKYKDLNYNTCSGGEMTDILNSGLLNVFSINQSDYVVTSFSGLGVQGGLQVSSPLRGALPIGPNGARAFDTLNSSPLEDLNVAVQSSSDSNSFYPSYTYTLLQQGIASNISCSRDAQSPIRVYPSDQSAVGTVQFNGTCDAQHDVWPDTKTFTSLNSNNSLTFWACKAPGANASSYLLYLRGLQNYAESIGNITCTASIQPAILKVEYDSYFSVFSSQNVIKTSPATFSGFIDQAVEGLGTIIADAQNRELNLVANSVTALGVRYFGLPADGQQDGYLELYEAMLQGILEYEVAYTRMLYSTITDRPPSCSRTVEGSTEYWVLGWWADLANVGYLLPMTIINLASLILLVVAMFRRKKGSFKDDPTDPEVLASAKPGDPVEAKYDKMGRRLFYPADE